MSRNLYDPPFHYSPRRPYPARYAPLPSPLEIEAYLAPYYYVRPPHERASSPTVSPLSSGRHRENTEARERGDRPGEASEDEIERVQKAVGRLSLVQQAPRDPEASARSRQYRLIQIRLLLVQVHDQLEIAHEVYEAAFKKFLGQVEKNKESSPETRNHIWVDMLSKDAEKGKKAAYMERSPLPLNFDTAMAQVETCLQSLEGAQMKNSPLASGFDDRSPDAEGHFKVVIDAVKEVVDLAAKAPEDNLVCEDLVARLDRARSLADTTSNIWKAVLHKLPARSSGTTKSNDPSWNGNGEEQPAS
ncbi:uncharacterized protein N0V96_000611 [Colletotrichum fioriniae]|uniref:uncharacterized protein n=1 Tax=Colletotrichum fioriniae TaxID=710243 RepID=UPI00230055F3|nr:uncharacterized protein COL516b_010886 [Colletotrichum fioriniae]KAJ0297305.1 hypothetical protein COL516b_010886 [Colletotrichum fioriniae]KAJ3949493.1 hypothetical protein N0V96_000611 [Colletotrichum fioriniae]